MLTQTCRWFLLIGNRKTNELLAIKKFSFKSKITKNINFTTPKMIDNESLTIYLFSDSYVGLDQEYSISLKSLNDKICEKYGITEIVTTEFVENLEDYSENEEILFDNW
jgi:hypothetical protein